MRKTLKSRGGSNVSNSVKKLLSQNNNINSEANINRLKRVMKKYIASPWNAIEKNIMNENTYNSIKNNAHTRKVPLNNVCKTRISTNNSGFKYQQKLCQSHSGNLFEHSQWGALQIIKWHNDNDEIMNGLDLETTVVSAFFHDIGKGGDCVQTCDTGCWFDMYSNEKYGGKGDATHPLYSGDMILGKIPFKLKCKQCNTKCELNIKELLEKEFPNIPVNQVALAAYMHWEFGKLNIPGKNDTTKVNDYLKMFKDSCAKCGLEPNDYLLRLCIAVAAADITAGSNRRLLPNVNGIIPAEEKFLGKDPWSLFGMDKKYLTYRQMLLDGFSKIN
jgi:hypothetical protein